VSVRTPEGTIRVLRALVKREKERSAELRVARDHEKKRAALRGVELGRMKLKTESLEKEVKASENRNNRLRTVRAQHAQQRITQTAEIPECVVKYTDAANQLESVAWVTVKHQWHVHTRLAGTATQESRFQIYDLESLHLDSERGYLLELHLDAEDWVSADQEYGR
jgi:hypothetical protein